VLFLGGSGGPGNPGMGLSLDGLKELRSQQNVKGQKGAKKKTKYPVRKRYKIGKLIAQSSNGCLFKVTNRTEGTLATMKRITCTDLESGRVSLNVCGGGVASNHFFFVFCVIPVNSQQGSSRSGDIEPSPSLSVHFINPRVIYRSNFTT
jgi:hypothetical protein